MGGCGAASSNVRKLESGEWDPAAALAESLQFGLAITALAFATAHSSGGHINCAVTWALMLVGKCHPIQAMLYLLVQLVGSIAGAGLLKASTDSTYSTMMPGAADTGTTAASRLI